MTRVTQNMLAHGTLANLQRSLARTSTLQEQLSTGRQLNRPSDSPGGAVTSLQTRSAIARREQQLRNADNATGWLDTADAALQGATTMLQRVRDLTVQAQNPTIGDIGRENIAREIEALRDGLLEVANTRSGDRLLFAGNADVPQAFDATGTFQGDTGTVLRTLADGQQLQVNVVGTQAFGDGATSVFTALADLAADVRTGSDTVGADHIGQVDGAINRVLTSLGEVGARTNRVDNMVERGTTDELNLRTRLSEVEDVDLAATIMELQLQEVAYQAALSATSRVIQPSLLDFLR